MLKVNVKRGEVIDSEAMDLRNVVLVAGQGA